MKERENAALKNIPLPRVRDYEAVRKRELDGDRVTLARRARYKHMSVSTTGKANVPSKTIKNLKWRS